MAQPLAEAMGHSWCAVRARLPHFDISLYPASIPQLTAWCADYFLRLRSAPRLFFEIAEAVEKGEYDGGVLIHEGRFVYERRNLELVADLGLEWERRTSLPLPLGIITASRALGKERIRAFEALLGESIAYAFAHSTASRDFIKAHAQELEDDVIDKHIALFVNDFSLSLGAEGRHAIEELVR